MRLQFEAVTKRCVQVLMSVNGACLRRPRLRTAGYGGVSAARATGIARSTINRGLKDLIAFDLAQQKVRRAGGGRPSLTQTDPTLLEDLQRLLEPATLGDPMRLLVSVSKSHAKLAARRCAAWGIKFRRAVFPNVLERLNYRRQVNRKTKEGSHHPDRDAQFEHINKQVMAFQAAGQPVISVDTEEERARRRLQELGQ